MSVLNWAVQGREDASTINQVRGNGDKENGMDEGDPEESLSILQLNFHNRNYLYTKYTKTQRIDSVYIYAFM